MLAHEWTWLTRLQDVGKELQEYGREFGVTTGRRRRCGWLDLVVLRYSHMINGYDAICLTKLDILGRLPEIKIGVAYKYKGQALPSFPGVACHHCATALQSLWFQRT